MDNQYASLHEVVDRRDHSEFDLVRDTTSVQPLHRKTAAEPTAAGTGWYHDAAIAEARQAAIDARCNPYHG